MHKSFHFNISKPYHIKSLPIHARSLILTKYINNHSKGSKKTKIELLVNKLYTSKLITPMPSSPEVKKEIRGVTKRLFYSKNCFVKPSEHRFRFRTLNGLLTHCVFLEDFRCRVYYKVSGMFRNLSVPSKIPL